MIGGSRNVSNWIAVYPFVYILPQRRVKGEEMVDKSSIWYLPKPFIKICHLSCASSFYLISSWLPSPLSPLFGLGIFFTRKRERTLYILSFLLCFSHEKESRGEKGEKTKESRRKIKRVDTEGMNGDAKKKNQNTK